MRLLPELLRLIPLLLAAFGASQYVEPAGQARVVAQDVYTRLANLEGRMAQCEQWRPVAPVIEEKRP